MAKWTCYDNGLQSAMIVRWPGRVKPGSVAQAMVEYVDICPTFVAAAGGQPADTLDGRSFLPVLRGETDKHKEEVYGLMTTRGIINGNNCYPIRSIRTEKYKLVWNLAHEEVFQNACTRSGSFQSFVAAAKAGDKRAQRVVERYTRRPEFELFNIENDPLELNNLAGEANQAERVQQLHRRLKKWMASQGDKGIETELAANSRQGNRGKKKESGKKKSKPTRP